MANNKFGPPDEKQHLKPEVVKTFWAVIAILILSIVGWQLNSRGFFEHKQDVALAGSVKTDLPEYNAPTAPTQAPASNVKVDCPAWDSDVQTSRS